VAESFVPRHGETQSARKRFEHGLDLMMRGAAVKNAEMHIGAGGLREALEEIFGEFGLKITDARAGNLGVDNAERAATQIDGAGGERFIHGHQKISGAQNSALAAEGFLHRLAKGDSDVFDGVVLIDVQIASRVQLEIERAVPSYEFQHVIEETNTRADMRFAVAVEIQAEGDIGLIGLTTNLCGSWYHSAMCRIAR
jgi:hypothetical protein